MMKIRSVIGILILIMLLSCGSVPTQEPMVKTVSYDDVMRFLAEDLTDQILYEPCKMVCWDFAEKLQQNARKAGIKCAVVTLAWEGSNRSHVINAFQTSDKGLIWIDVTGSHTPDVKGYDREIEPKTVGDTYLYEEIGGLPPIEVKLQKVSYDW